MRALDPKRYALGICAAAAILAGCGGSQSQIGALTPIAAGSDFLVATVGGGASNDGAVIALAPSTSVPWTETFVYSFGGTPDGANPLGDLFVDTQGNVYGRSF